MVNVGKREDALLDHLSQQRDLIAFLTDSNTAFELRLAAGEHALAVLEATHHEAAALCAELRRAFGLDNE